MSSSTINVINVDQWIDDNKEQFLPPVCNKLMHNEQLTIMFVGGPNLREDYHFEEGEELFLQLKGDMCLKVVEHNQHRDIVIREGEIFLLPGRVPHSPNRTANSIGLVMERRRTLDELDALRFYQKQSTERLFERWFHTTDLGIQLVPVIKEFFASDEHRTGRPKTDSFPEKPPRLNNEKIEVGQPFSFDQWLAAHQKQLNEGQMISVFDEKFQSRVYVMGKGQHTIDCSMGDVWLWQRHGRSEVKIHTGEDESQIELNPSDSVYLTANWKCTVCVNADALLLSISQDPRRK